MNQSKYPDELKDEAIALYKQGVKGEEIARRLGIPRPMIYVWAEQRGVKPSRQKRQQAAQGPTVEQLLEQLSERDRMIGQLEAKLARCEAQVDLLQSQN